MAGRGPSSRKPELAKQQDVARLAGVSSATVSLVLAGRTDRVSEPTRRKVFEAIRQLNYKAPALDVRTRGQISRSIGLLTPNLVEKPLARDYVFRQALDSILTECLRRNWGLTVMAETMWDDAGHTIRRSYDGRCDGMLVLAPEEDEIVRPFLDRGVPIVQVGITKRADSVSCVDVDNPAIGREAARRFYEAGHRAFLFVGTEGITTSWERQEAFLAEAKRLGATVRVFEAKDWSPMESFASLIPEWKREGISAAFCWCDGYACFLYKALSRLGLKVPADMSVISVEGNLSKPLRPALSGFRLPFEQLGKEAVDLLIRQIETGETTPKSVRLASKFVARSSVACRVFES